MQASLSNKPQSPLHKVENILIRYSCSKDILPGTTFRHPEKYHLLKYFPKYYNSLTLEITKENPFHSKIKSIKKLKKFTGYFKKNPSRKRWTHLLGNTRKDIEEIPRIIPTCYIPIIEQIFWARLMPWKMRFFPNVTRIFLPRRKFDGGIQDYDDALIDKKSFMRYLRRLKKVKTLEIFINEASDNNEKWMLEKLNGMNQFCGRLETIKMNVDNCDRKMRQEELFKNKNLASCMTNLAFSFGLETGLEQKFIESLQMCKNLRFLSMSLHRSMDGNPEFSEFLTSLQDLPNLLGLGFSFPKGVKYYWSSFKPQSSLCYLKLRLNVVDMVQAGLFGTEEKDVVGHWEDIEELDELELIISHSHIQEVVFVRVFITEVLKKVKKLCSFKCSIETFGKAYGCVRGEPFEVEEVLHLYESLEKFEYNFKNSSGGKQY